MISVYKILTETQFEQFKVQGIFAGSALDLEDGFIHLSTENQVTDVIKRYFKNAGPVYVIEFAANGFGDNLVFEASTNGDMYPHLYHVPLNFSEHKSIKTVAN